MQGARGYAELFETGQYGRFWIRSGSHARGRTFEIWLLPADHTVASIRPGDLHVTQAPELSKAVQIYGITGGQPGWTETYGWLHTGKWQEDFEVLVCQKIKEKNDKESARAAAEEKARVAEEQRKKSLLDSY